MIRMHDHEIKVSKNLVHRLLAAQMPEIADRSLTVVEPWGTDNAIWRLGDDLVVRLPRISSAVAQVELEATWLPRIAPHLTVAVPEPVAVGKPGHGYPFPWAVHRWIRGTGADTKPIKDLTAFALDLAEVVRSLRDVDIDGAPAARNRARPLSEYDEPTRSAIQRAGHLIDVSDALEVWERALAAEPYADESVWVHGDLEGNCLVRDGRLCGLVDWGSACAGDPAVDIQVVWSQLFDEASRAAFIDALEVDEATVTRSQGAAINQACAALPYYMDTYPLIVERSWRKLQALGVGTRPHRA